MEGVQMVLNMKEKQPVIREYKTRYRAATKKEKPVLPGATGNMLPVSYAASRSKKP
jgi:hypothetical protein